MESQTIVNQGSVHGPASGCYEAGTVGRACWGKNSELNKFKFIPHSATHWLLAILSLSFLTCKRKVVDPPHGNGTPWVLSTCRWRRTEGEISEIVGGILYLVGLTCESVSHSVMSDSATPWTITHRLLCPQKFPGKNTGVGCHSLLQRIFPTQGSNPGLLHCRWILYCLSHQGILNFMSPKGY